MLAKKVAVDKRVEKVVVARRVEQVVVARRVEKVVVAKREQVVVAKRVEKVVVEKRVEKVVVAKRVEKVAIDRHASARRDLEKRIGGRQTYGEAEKVRARQICGEEKNKLNKEREKKYERKRRE